MADILPDSPISAENTTSKQLHPKIKTASHKSQLLDSSAANADNARDILENNLKEEQVLEGSGTPDKVAPPEKQTILNLIGIKGLKEGRAADLAQEAMEKSRDIIKKFFYERFQEKYDQHFRKMFDAAQTPFARESIAIAQDRAQKRYDAEMNNRSNLSRAARKTWDFVKDHSFGSTTLERYAIEEIGAMQQNGQIKEQETFASEKQAFTKRFDIPFEASDMAIRKTLGEKLEILNPENAQHKPLVDGIKTIVRDYRDGKIADAKALDEQLQTLYKTTISPSRKDLFAEAETYASSISVVAKEMKDRRGHGESCATLDAELEGMQVRLGIGQMGEATEITPTETRKWVERIKNTARTLEKRGIINNALINEYTIGSAVSAVVSLKMLPQMAASATSRMWIGAGAGAAVTGVLSGRREFGRRQGELRRIGAQKEAGIQTPENAKTRQWYETFNFQLRSTTDLIGEMQDPILENGQLKQTLTETELRNSIANLTDAKARSAVSSRENNRFGLIILGPVGQQETNRTALANAMIETEKNLKTYLTAHRSEQIVTDILKDIDAKTYLDTLTKTQTQILTEGNQVLSNLTDPAIRLALDPLSGYTPEVDIMRRKLGIFGKTESKGKSSGIDAILQEFKTQAGVESARVGIKTAGIGLAFGALSNEVIMDIKHGFGSGAISGLFTHGSPDLAPVLPIHTEVIGSQNLAMGDNMHIDTGGNLDLTDGQGHIIHDAIPNFKDHYVNGALDEFARNKLHELGLDSSITTHDIARTVFDTPVETAGIPHQLPGAETIVDANGVAHTPEWTLPTGTHLNAIPGNPHVFNLVDTHGATIIEGIHTDTTGAITNLSTIQEHLPNGWHVLDATTNVQLSPETVIDPTTRTVNVYTDWTDRGDWGWTEKQLAGEHIDHLNPAVNAVKNVWRAYQHEFAPQGENISFDKTIPGLEHVERTLPFRNGELWPNALPNNSVIELPNSLFSDEHMAQLAHWNDEAIKLYDAQVIAHPNMAPMQILEQMQQEDRLHGLLLRIGRFSTTAAQSDLSRDELEFLMRELAGSHTTAAETMLHSITFTESIAKPLTEIVQEHIFTVQTPEGFIPILPFEVRQGLEVSQLFDARLFNSSGMYYGGESLKSLQEWIHNNPNLLHSYKKTINADGSETWLNEKNKPVTRDVSQERLVLQTYLDEIKQQDPEYYAYLEKIKQSPTLAPMIDDCRVAINIPACMEEKNIYQDLEMYIKQTDEQGNLLNPDLFEINIIVNRRTGKNPDQSVQEIKRFLDESEKRGEHFHINYVDVEFDPPYNNVGNARRVISDLTVMRSLQRNKQTQPLYFESEDADLMHVDPYTVINIIKKLDTNPQLDSVRGIQDRMPEELMKNDYLFTIRRLWDFSEMMLRSKKYRPENNPNWNFTWNRIITGGWNTAYTAEAYGLIKGYNRLQTKGEDMSIGEKITMIRGDGNMPNLEVIGTVGTRSDSSPRRFITEFISGKGAYSDSFEDENLNDFIKNADLNELQSKILPVSRIENANKDTFTNLLRGHFDAVKNMTPDLNSAKEFYDGLMVWMGIKKTDYQYTPDGNVEILSLDHLKQALNDYRDRHPIPRKSGERTRYSTS